MAREIGIYLSPLQIVLLRYKRAQLQPDAVMNYIIIIIVSFDNQPTSRKMAKTGIYREVILLCRSYVRF